MRRRTRWRDTFDTWPSLDITLRLVPWTWRFSFWQDWDMTSSTRLEFGPLVIDWFANRPMFAVEKDGSAP